MTLAMILGVCLLAAPSVDATGAVVTFMLSSPLYQQDQQHQESPSSPSQTTPGADQAPASTTQSVPQAQPSAPSNPAPAGVVNKPSPAAKPKTASSSPARQSKKRRHKKAAKASQTDPNRSKTVVRNGSIGEPAVRIAPSLTEQQLADQRQNVTQLLENTDANLKKSSARPLSASQQELVQQIQQYVEQAKTAGSAGDMDRARTLAFKARLLSEELVKP